MKIISLSYYIILLFQYYILPDGATHVTPMPCCKEISRQLQRDAGRVQTAGAPESTSIGHGSGWANGRTNANWTLEDFKTFLNILEPYLEMLG